MSGRFTSEAEAPAAGLLEAQAGFAVVEPALEQDEPGLQVVHDIGQPQAGIQPKLAIGEFGALAGPRSRETSRQKMAPATPLMR